MDTLLVGFIVLLAIFLCVLSYTYTLVTTRNARTDLVDTLLNDRTKLDVKLEEKEGEIRKLLNTMSKIEKHARADAVKRCHAGLKGSVSENFAPLSKDFPFKATDCRFIGDPIDFVVFNGLSDHNIASDQISVAFVEVKYGKSSLSTRQRRIRDAIKNGNVSWHLYKIEGD